MHWRHGDTLRAPEAAADARPATTTDLRGRLDRLSNLHPSSPSYPDSSWQRAIAGFAEAWQRHQERWPRPGHRTERTELGTAVERQLEQACEKIQAAEQQITGWLRSLEAEDPGRALAGIEYRLKGQDRLIEKARQNLLHKPDRTPETAMSMIPDAVRYTLCYDTDDYSTGVRSDIDRLKAAGFEMLRVKNFWSYSEYRGVNSQWRDQQTGQRFEVQFHTALSFEAKQVTHGAYERLRQSDVTEEEELELERFQRDVTATVPFPPGALDIPEHS